MAAAPPTAEQIDSANKDYQDAVKAQSQASGDYDTTVSPFVDKRKALRAANAAVAEKHAALTKLLSAAVDPSVPPVPTDEE